jgi:hypothetical protein
LWELPSILPPHTSRPQQLTLAIRQNNAHIRAKSVSIYHGNDPYIKVAPSSRRSTIIKPQPGGFLADYCRTISG